MESAFLLIKDDPNLVIQKPEWEWMPEQDWCCPLPSDVPTWVFIVSNSLMNVSISSTVTLEFARLDRPVINVCFDLPVALEPTLSNKRFWDADFYSDVRRDKFGLSCILVR